MGSTPKKRGINAPYQSHSRAFFFFTHNLCHIKTKKAIKLTLKSTDIKGKKKRQQKDERYKSIVLNTSLPKKKKEKHKEKIIIISD